MTTRIAPLAALALIAFAGAAQAEIKTVQTGLGPVLADDRGMTLYTFDKDETGKSNCIAECARNWPPLPADGAAMGDYSVVERADGGKQLAYKGRPLYLWVKDSKPGDTSGDGVKGVWHAARP